MDSVNSTMKMDSEKFDIEFVDDGTFKSDKIFHDIGLSRSALAHFARTKFQSEIPQSRTSRAVLYGVGFGQGFEAALALVKNTGANVRISREAMADWVAKFLKS